jgi:hypothetical protein
MSGYITEFFGYRANDLSETASQAAASGVCPFLKSRCSKVLSRDGTVAGVCAIKQMAQNSPNVICCPIRLYADNYRLLYMIASKAFGKMLPLYAGRAAVEWAVKNNDGAVAVFGHGWGGELRLPQRQGAGAYFVDWVLARLDGNGELMEFTAVEVQTIDTTGNYRTARDRLLHNHEIIKDTMGLNWENVSKRIIPQLIYKGQVLQRENLCRTGLYFVSPRPVYERVFQRLGGKEKLPEFPSQPASIHFISYDYLIDADIVDGQPKPLTLIEEYITTVYKIQEAFSALNLPEGNVYRDAIRRSLYDS